MRSIADSQDAIKPNQLSHMGRWMRPVHKSFGEPVVFYGSRSPQRHIDLEVAQRCQSIAPATGRSERRLLREEIDAAGHERAITHLAGCWQWNCPKRCSSDGRALDSGWNWAKKHRLSAIDSPYLNDLAASQGLAGQGPQCSSWVVGDASDRTLRVPVNPDFFDEFVPSRVG